MGGIGRCESKYMYYFSQYDTSERFSATEQVVARLEQGVRYQTSHRQKQAATDSSIYCSSQCVACPLPVESGIELRATAVQMYRVRGAAAFSSFAQN